jgi:lipoprotein-releasing system permease protein
MSYKFFIARRFIFSRHRLRVINVISLISVAGIIVGVTTTIVVMSVLNGFFTLVSSLFVSIDADIRIEAKAGKFMPDYANLLADLRQNADLRTASPFIEAKALMVSGKEAASVYVKGIDSVSAAEMITKIQAGRLPNNGEPLQATVGLSLADRMGLGTTMTFQLITPELLDNAATIAADADQSPLSMLALQTMAVQVPSVTVSGLFSVQRLYDDAYVLMPIEQTQRLFKTGSGVSGIELRLKNTADIEAVKLRLAEKLKGQPFEVKSIYDRHKDLFRVMKLEKWGSFLILMLIVVVASLSLIGSLVMTVLEKKEEIAILKILGAKPNDVRRLFIWEGTLVGLLGAGVGLAVAMAVCELQVRYGLVKLPYADAFIISAYPVSIDWTDFVVVAFAALLLTMLASLYPAAKAEHLSVTEAVRTSVR